MTGRGVTIRRGVALLLLAGVLVAGALVGHQRALAPPALAELDAVIAAAAREFAVDADLLRAMAAAESGGDPRAVSRAGAVGVLQLMPATAREEARRLGIEGYDEDRLFEADLNVRLGASYFRRLLERFDREEAFAIAAYNAGPTRVLQWRERAPDASPREVIEREGFDETRRHVRKVLRWRAAYKAAR